MAISDLIKEMRQEKKLKPGKLAVELLSSAAGVKLIKGVIKTKVEFDKRVRNIRNFAGVPSTSDQDKVDRAIARVGSRLRDVEKQLDELDNSLDEFEKNTEASRQRKSARRKESIIQAQKITKSSATDSRSLTNVIELLRPVQKSKSSGAGRKASKTVAPPKKNKNLRKSKPARKKSREKIESPFALRGGEKSAASSLLNINLKK